MTQHQLPHLRRHDQKRTLGPAVGLGGQGDGTGWDMVLGGQPQMEQMRLSEDAWQRGAQTGGHVLSPALVAPCGPTAAAELKLMQMEATR